MEKITMNKAKLLEVVKTNREKHRSVFLEAQDGYRKAAITQLERSLEDARQGRKIRQSIMLQAPSDMTKEYDQVIQMLEFHTEPEVEITHEEFRNYVLDNWRWSGQWSTSNVSYTTSPASRQYLAEKSGEATDY